MEPVISVNLAGNAYQLESSAHAALKAYLDRAEAALAANPDKGEIIRDLEQAVADKANAFLSAYKTVITGADMARILEELGPVQSDEPEASESASASARQNARAQDDATSGAPHKRLYRIRDGAMFAGVCAGLGAFFAVDANIIRIVFVILALITHGFMLLVYVAMMFLVPSAHTSAEWAAAHGLPSTAQEVIDQAKRNFSEFTGPGGKPWRWRREARRAWRQEMRARARAWAQTSAPAPSGPFGWIARIFGAIFMLVFSLVGAALLIAFIVTLISLVTTGAVLGYILPWNLPLWLSILIICIAYGAVAAPIGALADASRSALTGRPAYAGPHHRDGGGFIALAVIFAILYYFAPGFHAWTDQAWDTLGHVWRALFPNL